jgi:transposase-like protein
LGELTRRLLERALEAEITEHLGGRRRGRGRSIGR